LITGLSTGGAEMMLLKVLEHLDKRFSAHVISLTTMGDIGPRIQALGIPVDAMGMSSRMPNPFTLIRLARLLKSLAPDVVHTWMYHADLLGGVAARLAGVGPIGWCIRHSDLDRGKTKLSTRVVVAACARVSGWVPDRILCCSEVARKVHVASGYAAKKMVVVPNGFDLARFRPDPFARDGLRRELGLAADSLLVGLVGRFDPQKDHAGFLQAAGLLHRRFPSAHFVLAGSRVDAGNRALMDAAQLAGVQSVTHFLGLRADVPRLMAAFDVFVSSSSYGEGFPNVVGEAMACATPCVVTDVGDSAHIVGDAGRVVPPGDFRALAAEVTHLLAMPAEERRAVGARARTRVAENFEVAAVVKRYESFYDELAAVGHRESAGA
jgi:glycosyltransferase involved in cell wall biosynthesis